MKKITVKIDLEFEEDSLSITNNKNGKESVWINDEYGIEITQKNNEPISENDVKISAKGVSISISKKDIAKAFQNIIVLIFFALNTNFVSAQTDLKQYSSKFGEGQATYTFYEDEDGRRIFHGDFIYQFRGTDGGSCNIKGKYSNGNRDGHWVFEFKRNAGQTGGSYKTGGYYEEVVDEENYKIEVLPNGSKKKIYNVKRVWLPEKTEYYQKTIAKVDLSIIGSYDNGLENGNWLYKNNGKTDTLFVKSGIIIDKRQTLVNKLTTDEKDFLHGTIKISYNGFIYSSEFYHGYLIQTKKINPNSEDGNDMQILKPTFSFSDNQSDRYKYVPSDSCSNDPKILKKYIDECYSNYLVSDNKFLSNGNKIILSQRGTNNYIFLFTTDIRYFENMYEYPFANEDIKKMKGIIKPSEEIENKIVDNLEGKKVYILSGGRKFDNLNETEIIKSLAIGGMGCSPSYCPIEYSILNKSTFNKVTTYDNIILGFHCFSDNGSLSIYKQDNETVYTYFAK
ncbi:MAG: hypothetical protein RLZZ546_551 [Bacteroidota bacterium]|jgi:hypothetical protein